jgi:membrane protein YdbS with pleckstrin-like domain
VPKRLYRVLLRTERVLWVVRKHPAEIAWPWLGTFLGLCLAAALTPTAGAGHPSLQGVIWVAWLILAGYAVWRYIDWRATYFVVTGRRVILLTGVFTRRSKTMPIAKLTELEVIESPISQIFDYATFRIESAGDADLGLIRFMPIPGILYEEIMLRVTGPLEGDMVEAPATVPPDGGDGESSDEDAEPPDPGF